jgi:nitroimidazol reductase NimA-like FMN-containing flavoprotein (pyridoxamine 5'-phosphate oxidase superfamily)
MADPTAPAPNATVQLRRSDRAMTEQETLAFLQSGFCGRLGTVGADGAPYVVPLLYVFMDGQIWVHNTSARGHLRTNIDHEARVCFEIDEPGEVFPYGAFECDTSISYRSAIVFGRARVVDDSAEKTRFCSALMEKYADRSLPRPKDVFPRLDAITVYTVTLERVTGKRNLLPDVGRRWPAVERR